MNYNYTETGAVIDASPTFLSIVLWCIGETSTVLLMVTGYSVLYFIKSDGGEVASLTYC